MIYIVIPTYNEADNILLLVEALNSLDIDERTILFVDDNSPDGTGEIAKDISQSVPNIEVIHNPGKVGLGNAYMKGFTHIYNKPDVDTVITMDADFSHDPQFIPDMLDKRSTHDYIVGSRYIPEGKLFYPFHRRLISSIGVNTARLLLDLSIHDCTSAYRCFSKDVLEYILKAPFTLLADGYFFQVEVNYQVEKAGFSMTEVPIVFRDRERGKSKLSIGKEIIKGVTALCRLKFAQGH